MALVSAVANRAAKKCPSEPPPAFWLKASACAATGRPLLQCGLAAADPAPGCAWRRMARCPGRRMPGQAALRVSSCAGAWRRQHACLPALAPRGAIWLRWPARRLLKRRSRLDPGTERAHKSQLQPDGHAMAGRRCRGSFSERRTKPPPSTQGAPPPIPGGPGAQGIGPVSQSGHQGSKANRAPCLRGAFCLSMAPSGSATPLAGCRDARPGDLWAALASLPAQDRVRRRQIRSPSQTTTARALRASSLFTTPSTGLIASST